MRKGTWGVVRVDLVALSGKVNMTLPCTGLRRIDASARAVGETRS